MLARENDHHDLADIIKEMMRLERNLDMAIENSHASWDQLRQIQAGFHQGYVEDLNG